MFFGLEEGVRCFVFLSLYRQGTWRHLDKDYELFQSRETDFYLDRLGSCVVLVRMEVMITPSSVQCQERVLEGNSP